MRRLRLSLFAIAGLTLTGSLVTLAADIPVTPVYKAPVTAPVLFAWTGCYVGGQVGYGAGSSSPTWANGLPPGTPLTNKLDVNGVLGGITLGCNYQLARNWVLGVEGDYSWADKHDGSPLAPPENPNHTFSVKERSFATARLRLGYAADRWLLFVTGGAAWARVNATDVNNGTVFRDSDTHTLSGWTIGGGAEYALTGNWSVKGEYLYADFGTSRYFTLPTITLGGQADVPLTQHVFRAGINYRFSWTN